MTETTTNEIFEVTVDIVDSSRYVTPGRPSLALPSIVNSYKLILFPGFSSLRPIMHPSLSILETFRPSVDHVLRHL